VKSQAGKRMPGLVELEPSCNAQHMTLRRAPRRRNSREHRERSPETVSLGMQLSSTSHQEARLDAASAASEPLPPVAGSQEPNEAVAGLSACLYLRRQEEQGARVDPLLCPAHEVWLRPT
jgi:hypothetical protein